MTEIGLDVSGHQPRAVDPSALQGTLEEKLKATRQIRDQIKSLIEREFGESLVGPADRLKRAL